MAKAPKQLKRVSDLKPDTKNANRGTERGVAALEDSISQLGLGRSVLIDKDGKIIAGNKTVERAVAAGIEDMIVVQSDGRKLVVVQRTDLALDSKADDRGRRLATADNRIAELDLDWDPLAIMEMKEQGLDMLSMGFNEKELSIMQDRATMEADDYDKPFIHLHDKFLVPPFSILDSTQAYWLKRKRQWWQLGMESTAGRKGDAYARKGTDHFGAQLRTQKKHRDTTDFDPVMGEVAYRWFCPEDGLILDPFAGGCCRGIVASFCKRRYIGVDVRPEQIAENKRQAIKICKKSVTVPTWIAGGSQHVIPKLDIEADFIFSSPPYAGIEVHSDLADDISNKDYDDFLRIYREIIQAAVSKLKDNRFAAFVVGDARDKRGFYKNFPADTITAFQDAGATLYNEAILVTPVVNLAFRISSHFPNYRKLGKRHQNVLVFYKGDPKKIPEHHALLDVPPPEELDGIQGESDRLAETDLEP